WFLDYFTRKFNRPRIELTTEDTKALMDYKWPGNVRELKNVIERYALMADEAGVKAFLPLNPKSSPDNLLSDNPDLDELQRRYITLMLDRSNGRIGGPGGAAKLLGMKRTSLYARMRKLGM
ncbi:Fis family transcriptional regulator, partial [bacterium]|nr:Fis family transcriptional regulator [bacterium]